MPHFVYILQSEKDNKYYIGETYDVEARLVFHNSGKQRSIKTRVPFKLVLVEEYENRSLALKRESRSKAGKAVLSSKD